jgi:peptidoglycan hydrolase-like protein with peptidoglycan-binding domain
MDVEQHAWTPADVPAWTSKCTAPRPTVYCSRADLAAVRAVWQGDVWLAWPGWKGEPLPSHGIVAVQDVWASNYDSSTVLDDTWPGTPQPPPGVPAWQEEAMQALPTIGQGATGPDVRTCQGLCVARASSPPVAVDGVFGPQTRAAVEVEQRAAGIAVDGVVGPQTWPVLMGVA